LGSKMGEWVYGCDVCQEVCPHNSPKASELLDEQANPAYRSARDSFDLLEVLGWNEDDRREAFTGSAMKRAKLEMMQRNAAIALGNRWCFADHGDQQQTLDALRRLEADEQSDSLARLGARDALASIDPSDPGDHEHHAHPGEQPD